VLELSEEPFSISVELPLDELFKILVNELEPSLLWDEGSEKFCITLF